MKTVDQKTYNTIAASLFLIVAAAHLLRIIFGWPVQIGGVGIPMWLSWLALVVTGALAYFGFRQNISPGNPPG
jgi:TRAP-type C4-dicarboxylate transport system permease small subunit